jgi:predicted DNA-binding protein (UPF0251 family)
VEIGRRLGCSERHVRRILKNNNIETSKNPLVGTPDEPLLWHYIYIVEGNFAKVAYKMGVSRQAVHKSLTQTQGV